MQSPDFKEQVYPLGDVEAPDTIPKGKRINRCVGAQGLGIREG